MSNKNFQQFRTKVGAFTHDPPEKAAILMEGGSHEAGTVATIQRALFGEAGIPPDMRQMIARADHFAAAADRPDRPRPGRCSFWDSVRFQKRPVLIHPLSGEAYDLERLELAPTQLERFSTDHLEKLITRDEGGNVDWYRTFLSFWRLGPDIQNAGDFGALWSLWPADTRVPDHCIWDHLGLASCFAGIFDRGETPALLMVSLGPVQTFISQARSTSDLWAGSHLLSRMSWEAMRVVAEAEGPDALVFPNLWGVPQVDLWLEGLGLDLGDQDWKQSRSDANPLFLPALPNRFLAIVPEGNAGSLARRAAKAARRFVREQALVAWERLRTKAGLERGDDDAVSQIEEQCQGFPEVHWSSAPFSLGLKGKEEVEAARLRHALSRFYEGEPGFLGSDCFQMLSQNIEVEGASFYRPNAGILYPALYDLADRGLAAAKAARPFSQLRQMGYRCSLCGEREWLAPDRSLVRFARGSGQKGDPFAKLAASGSTLIKGSEHLCAICCLKRLWPEMYAEEVGDSIHDHQSVRRYVVSTHTMALAPVLDRLTHDDKLDSRLLAMTAEEPSAPGFAALPRRIARDLQEMEKRERREAAAAIQSLPLRLERAEQEGDPDRLARRLKRLMGVRPETYYALVLMDGDRMGAWFSSLGGGKRSARAPGRPAYGDLWHPDVKHLVEEQFQGNDRIKRYMEASAPPSPAYHASVSRALNELSVRVVPAIVEGVFAGKVLYAGGDDLMAMLPVFQLLPAILALRCAFSGVVPGRDPDSIWELLKITERGHLIGGGHVLLKDPFRGDRLCRVMGSAATASFGAVIAHHMTPLQTVLGSLREAERTAKRGRRDAFCIKLAKRSGGTTTFTSGFHLGEGDAGLDRAATGVLLRTTELLRRLSRRAAYSIMAWLGNMPASADGEASAFREMLTTAVAFQLMQHRGKEDISSGEARSVAEGLVDLALVESSSPPAPSNDSETLGREPAGATGFIIRALQLCEFLARSERNARGAA